MSTPMIGPLEAVLFAAGSDGLSSAELAGILQLSEQEAASLCRELQTALENADRGIALTEVAGVWQLCTRPDHVSYIRRMATSPTSSALSAAALETLAIIAYQQPVTRQDVESIRGVQSDRAIQTLVHRQLVTEVGRQDAPGRPILYGTTDHFLTTFGLYSLEDLPPLPENQEMSEDISLFDMNRTAPRD